MNPSTLRQIADRIESGEDPGSVLRQYALVDVTGALPSALMHEWVTETECVTTPLFKAPRRLTDTEIGELWFAARIPGLVESDARRLIRAAEEKMK